MENVLINLDIELVSLSVVSRNAREYFAHFETSPWTVKGCQTAYAPDTSDGLKPESDLI